MTEGHPITDGITLLLNARSLTKHNRRFHACFSGLRTAHALFPSMGRLPDGNERIVKFIVVLRYDIQFVRPTAIENNKRLMYVGCILNSGDGGGRIIGIEGLGRRHWIMGKRN